MDTHQPHHHLSSDDADPLRHWVRGTATFLARQAAHHHLDPATARLVINIGLHHSTSHAAGLRRAIADELWGGRRHCSWIDAPTWNDWKVVATAGSPAGVVAVHQAVSADPADLGRCTHTWWLPNPQRWATDGRTATLTDHDAADAMSVYDTLVRVDRMSPDTAIRICTRL